MPKANSLTLTIRLFLRATLISAALTSTGVSLARGESIERFVISSNRDFKRTQKLMNESAAEAVVVKIEPGEYKLRKTFHIMRSNVTVMGEKGVKLRLANRAQTPVISVGTQSSVPADAERISHIAISDLVIDGNKEKQRNECDRSLPWIRNNGIDARLVTGLTVERVTSGNNRSGGLVISWRSRDVQVRDCVFENNYFDGVAYYDSSNVYTTDCIMRGNSGAGVSLDNAFVDSAFIRCRIESNHDVGVFARNSQRLVFFECSVSDSGNWAFFLAHDDNQRGVFDVDIASCSIDRNNGGLRMGSLEERQSARNSVMLTSFSGNGMNGREDLSTAGSQVQVINEAWSADSSVGPEYVSPYTKRVQALLDVEQPDRS